MLAVVATASPGRRLATPLLFILDEAANVCRIRQLPDLYLGQYAAALLGNDGAALPSLPLHDPLAAALLADPELGTYQQQRVAVDLSESELRGQTDPHP